MPWKSMEGNVNKRITLAVLLLLSLESFGQAKSSKIKDIVYRFPEETIKKIKELKADPENRSVWDCPTYIFFQDGCNDTLKLLISYVSSELLVSPRIPREYVYAIKNTNRFLEIEHKKVPVLFESDYYFFGNKKSYIHHQDLVAYKVMYIKKSDGSFLGYGKAGEL